MKKEELKALIMQQAHHINRLKKENNRLREIIDHKDKAANEVAMYILNTMAVGEMGANKETTNEQ